jgi:NitT/TauT family transport system substrate-binding protein
MYGFSVFRFPLSALVGVLFFSWVGLAFAQLTPMNFVYTGSGGQTDALKFTHENGFFKKHGIDATMIYVVSGVTTAQAITAGSAPMATTTGTDALRALAAGASFKIVMVNIDRFQHLFVARPGINGPKDMKGKKIAVSRYGAFSDVQTRFLVRQWGMDPDKDVQILQIGNSAARAAAMASGGVDGGIVTPSFIPAAKKAGLNVIFDMSKIPGKFANQIAVANERFIKEKPAVVKAVVAGFLDGIKHFRTNAELGKAYLKKGYGISDAEAESVYLETRQFIRPDPTPDLEGIQNAWDAIPELRAKGDVDLSKFIEGRFVAEVLKEMK